MHALFVFFNNLVTPDTIVIGMLVLKAPDLIFVALHDPLDLWLQSFDCLCSDLVDLLFLPLLLAHLLSCCPCILIFLQLDLQPVIHDLFLALNCLVTRLHSL